MVTNSNFIILIDIRYIKKKGTYLLLSAKSWIASIHGNWKENNHNCKSIIMEEDDTKPYWSFLLGLTRMFNIRLFFVSLFSYSLWGTIPTNSWDLCRWHWHIRIATLCLFKLIFLNYFDMIISKIILKK